MDKSAKHHTTAEAENHYSFKGIRLRKWGKWVSEVRMPKSRAKIWLGSYDTAEQAARAYDAAVFCLRGSKAKFNFPNSIPDIPSASSLSPPQIQVAAAKYALRLIPSINPNPNCNNSNSNTALTEREPPAPSMSSDNLLVWEENLWEPFVWDSGLMDLEDLPSVATVESKASEIWVEEEGCIIFDTPDIWSWS